MSGIRSPPTQPLYWSACLVKLKLHRSCCTELIVSLVWIKRASMWVCMWVGRFVTFGKGKEWQMNCLWILKIWMFFDALLSQKDWKGFERNQILWHLKFAAWVIFLIYIVVSHGNWDNMKIVNLPGIHWNFFSVLSQAPFTRCLHQQSSIIFSAPRFLLPYSAAHIWYPYGSSSA